MPLFLFVLLLLVLWRDVGNILFCLSLNILLPVFRLRFELGFLVKLLSLPVQNGIIQLSQTLPSATECLHRQAAVDCRFTELHQRPLDAALAVLLCHFTRFSDHARRSDRRGSGLRRHFAHPGAAEGRLTVQETGCERGDGMRDPENHDRAQYRLEQHAEACPKTRSVLHIIRKTLGEGNDNCQNKRADAQLDGQIEHRADSFFLEKLEFLRDAESQKRKRHEREGIELDLRHSYLDSSQNQANQHGKHPDNIDQCKAEIADRKLRLIPKRPEDDKSVVDDTVRTELLRRDARYAPRKEADHLEAFAERGRRPDPFVHQENEKSETEHLAQKVQHLIAVELEAQIPSPLDDGENDQDFLADGQDIDRAGNNNILDIVLHEIAKDVKFAAGFQMKLELLCRASDSKRIRAEPHVEKSAAEVPCKAESEHDLPKEFFLIFHAETDHDEGGNRHKEHDKIRRLDQPGADLKERLVEKPAETRSSGKNRLIIRRDGKGRAMQKEDSRYTE